VTRGERRHPQAAAMALGDLSKDRKSHSEALGFFAKKGSKTRCPTAGSNLLPVALIEISTLGLGESLRIPQFPLAFRDPSHRPDAIQDRVK
jgi:hypothetical protein